MQVQGTVLLSALAISAFLAVPAQGQIVLPGKKSAEKGNVAPHYVCLTCNARNYELHDESRRDNEGNVIGWCSTCKHDTSQKLPGAGTGISGSTSGRSGRLVLPSSPPPRSVNRTKAPAPAGTSGAKPAAKPETSGAARSTERAGPADFIFAEVKKHKRFDDSLATHAVESLLALGEDGLAASRRNLHADEAPALMTAARVLLRSGLPEDADLVCERMRERLPIAAGGPLLELLVRVDPVRASPAFLTELLDHPHVGVRIEAQRRLLRLLTPTDTSSESSESDGANLDLVRILEPALGSKRADTRQRAADILARVEGAAATRLLLEHVADPAANVVAAVADGLAVRADPDLDARLLGMAFRERWVLRTGACSLLALVEREDRMLRPILDASHVEPLLSGLQSGDPFLAGACAVGLAGIGFRSRDVAATAWLDREVLDRLVTTISGKQFHSDLPALTGPTLRRLGLLTGQPIGSDGPRWLEWWMQSREGFFARRAWLEVRPEDVPRLSIRYEQSGTDRLAFTLLGPENESSVDRSGFASSSIGSEETIRLDSAQARDLVLALEREGLFGPEKLPGLRGLRGGERTLQVLLGSRGKSFTFGSGQNEPWFDRTVSLVRDLLDRNRWQRYPDPSRHLSPHELWLQQSAWWGEEHTDAERALRMKTLVLAALPVRVDAGRDEGIGELERAYGQGGPGSQEGRTGIAEPDDFLPLTRLLGSEPFWSERARRLLDLCLLAAAAPGAIGEEATPAAELPDARRQLPPDRGRVLVDLMMERFPNAPPGEMARIFSACGDDFADMMSSDPRAPVRVAAARNVLERKTGAGEGGELSPSAVATLLRLLGDPERSVESAAVEALGRHRVEAARTELLVRARLAVPEVRAAALRAIGRLRGELVLDALSLAASDRDPSIRQAAAWGLSDLADPVSAPLLIDLLGDGEGTPTAEAARAGLLALGPAAYEPLLRVVHSQNHPGRREATLILSRQAVPEAASALIAMLSTSPRDEHVASELCVLTAVDLRAEPNPATAWWSWWDGVVHDDALAWFLAAVSRAGGSPPASSDLEGTGTREGRLSMVEVLSRREAHLVERARRELSRMLGSNVGPLPPRGEGRDAWIANLRESLTGSEAR